MRVSMIYTDDDIEEFNSELDRLRSENAELRAALVRIMRAFESDAEQVPDMTILTSFQSNGAAYAQARAILERTKK